MTGINSFLWHKIKLIPSLFLSQSFLKLKIQFMKNIKILFISLIAISTFFYSCKKDNSDNNSGSTEKTYVVDATNPTKWVYFSFNSGDTLKVIDPLNSTDWDLAFKNTNIRTNSGKSGKGQGGAFLTNTQNASGFSTLVSVPGDVQFTYDDTMKVIVYMGYANDTVNSALYSWYSYDHLTHLIVPSNNIYIIKTASGKYAKLWIKNYYKDSDLAMGYLKFTYFYQPDGSVNLK